MYLANTISNLQDSYQMLPALEVFLVTFSPFSLFFSLLPYHSSLWCHRYQINRYHNILNFLCGFGTAKPVFPALEISIGLPHGGQISIRTHEEGHLLG